MQVINLITQREDKSKKKKRDAPYSGFKTQFFVINIPQTSERTKTLSLSNNNNEAEGRKAFKMYLSPMV